MPRGYARITVQFEEIRERRSRTGECSVCGKRVTRTQTFTATLSPFNLGPTGKPATYTEALHKLIGQADKWVPDFRHETCKGGAGDGS